MTRSEPAPGSASFQVGDVTLEILDGDISAIRADAIVNAANSALWMGSGVAGAIKRRGGVDIEREAMALGPIVPGDAVMTGGGRLQARHVIHAAVMGQDLRTDERLIDRATRSALDLAKTHGLTSIALPAFGTGVGGFPLARSAAIMLAVVEALAAAPGSLRRIVFALYGRDALAVFMKEARAKFGRGLE
ncbi:MAG: macro domain-containing protein [Acidobacteria bacterium]|nr:macro domain-containing protein [Acidobacteriota bacterium]